MSKRKNRTRRLRWLAQVGVTVTAVLILAACASPMFAHDDHHHHHHWEIPEVQNELMGQIVALSCIWVGAVSITRIVSRHREDYP